MRSIIDPTYHDSVWQRIEKLSDDVRSFIQRGRRGYADCDLWNLSGYISEWMPLALRDIVKYSYAYPIEFNTTEEWDEVLAELIWVFETMYKTSGRGNEEWWFVPTSEWTEDQYDRQLSITNKINGKYDDMKSHVMTYDECARYERGLILYITNLHNIGW